MWIYGEIWEAKLLEELDLTDFLLTGNYTKMM